MKVKFKKFSSRACLPTLATPGSACFDVYSSRCVTLEPGVKRSIETDLVMKFAKKYVARTYPRSGLKGEVISLYQYLYNFDKSLLKNFLNRNC